MENFERFDNRDSAEREEVLFRCAQGEGPISLILRWLVLTNTT